MNVVVLTVKSFVRNIEKNFTEVLVRVVKNDLTELSEVCVEGKRSEQRDGRKREKSKRTVLIERSYVRRNRARRRMLKMYDRVGEVTTLHL